MDVDPRWYETFFGEDWLRLAVEHGRYSDDETLKQVDFAVERLGLEPPARILDLAGGHGRHAIPLAQRGFRVTLLDLSEPSLAVARERAADAGVELDIVHADMRDIAYDEEFDAVLNLFTAFGYFEDEADDVRLVERMARALVPGGALLVDLVSLFGIVREFQPRSWLDVGDGWTMLDEREYDVHTGRSAAAWTFLGPNGERRELRHSVRLYTLPELRSMLGGAGLTVEGAWLNWDGEEYRFDGRGRMIVAARKSLSQP
jgi:SAM-dependent methyltransferase